MTTTPKDNSTSTPNDVSGDVPTDGTTLTEVVDAYRRSGASADFFAEEGGRVTCGACNSTLEASRFSMLSQRRLEGASDPADMVSVVVTQCPACGAQGTIVLGFGPMASGADLDVAADLQDRREADSPLPRDATPEEDASACSVGQSAPEPSQAMASADVANGEGPPE